MNASYPPGPVRQLLVEMAEEDARGLAVNAMLYQRSAVYQRALDAQLASQGYFVSGRRGDLRVTAARSGAGRARGGQLHRDERSGPCCGGIATVRA